MSLIFTQLSTIFCNTPKNSTNLTEFPPLPIKLFKSSKLCPSKTLNFTCNSSSSSSSTSSIPSSETKFTFSYDIDEESSDSPWEGAIIYKRDPTVTHLEYCTTLERLGLGKFSTEVSKSRASLMGLRVTKAVKDYPLGTPVMISVDVLRKKHKLRLDGIVKTVLSLGCNRCGEPAAECVFSNFTLLLSEEAVEEGDVINMGTIFGESKQNTAAGEDDDNLIDIDDRLYFPAEENEIDISKNIRDLVHVEITINAVCHLKCKGLCLRCGANLNTSTCRCQKEEEDANVGPLHDLKNKMRK